jgi:hypothetical protein
MKTKKIKLGERVSFTILYSKIPRHSIKGICIHLKNQLELSVWLRHDIWPSLLMYWDTNET